MPLLSQGGTRLVGFGLLVATFLVGALAGAAVDRVLSADEAERRERSDRDEDHRSYVIDEVELAPEQREAIDAILERRSERMRAVWRESAPRLAAITDSARMEIMEVLTPEQRAEYERRLEERRARYEERRDNDGRARGEESADSVAREAARDTAASGS